MSELNEKQVKILQIAEKLFADKGFDGTSVRDISREAKTNIAMVSYYFGSKEKMLEALILYRSSDMKLQLQNLLSQDFGPMEKLERVIELYIARVNKNRCIYQIIHFELASKKRALNFASFNEVKKTNLALLEKLVHEGQEIGIFRKDVNIALIPTTILGTYFQFQMSRPMFEDILNLKTDKDFEHYIKNDLTKHIKQTIKAFLTHEI